MTARSPLEALAQTPRRFGFDAAVRVLTLARRNEDPAEVAHFRSPPGLTYPPADVLEVRGTGKPDITVGMMGLTGPSGVLPRHYTDAVVQALRNRSSSLHTFLDTLSHRFVAFFARAGAKYRPARAADMAAARTPPVVDPVSKVLLALSGLGTPHLTDRMLIGTPSLLHYAGLFAMRPRSAQRLGAMVSDWLGMRVEVIEFAGAWLTLPLDQRSRIGAIGQFNRLSTDAAAGVRAWDPQARVVLRIGPLDRAGFERLLPDRVALHRLVSLVRAYVGYEIGFAINPVLAAGAVPPLRLDSAADPPPRLGWNTWLEPVGLEPVGLEPVGLEPVGLEPVGLEPVGLEPVGLEPVGLEPVGLEPVGLEPVGLEPVWLEPMAGGRKRLADAAEPVFEAEIIEAQRLPENARIVAAKELAR
jgi:type VI secretion system protein ImpH